MAVINEKDGFAKMTLNDIELIEKSISGINKYWLDKEVVKLERR